MKIVFYSTSDVFEAEEMLGYNEIECIIVPTPTTDKAYCGVCIETKDVEALCVLKGFEYDVVDQG